MAARSRYRTRRPSFRVGAVLGRSFAIYFRNVIPFTTLALLFYSPLAIYTASVFVGDPDRTRVQTWGWIALIAPRVISLLLTGAVVYGVVQQLRGRRGGLVDCLLMALQRFFPMLGVLILQGSFMLLAALPFFVLLMGMGAGFARFDPVALLLLMLVLLVPLAYVAAMFWVAQPVAVVERPGVRESIGRSTELTRGNRWGLFGIIVFFAVIGWALDQLLQRVFMSHQTLDELRIYVWASLASGMVLGAIQAVTAAVAYHDLRLTKEGVGVEELASVFD